MILNSSELLFILATAAVCTAVVMLVALLVLRLGRRRSIAFQFTVVVIAAIVSIALTTVVVTAQMYLSAHDLQVVLWVVGISTVMSLGAALVSGRAVRRAFAKLRESVAQVGAGDVVAANSDTWKEVAEVSVQLSEASQRLAAARDEITRLDASRRQFFAWISHDLRTPLTGISALAEALDAGVVDDPSDYLRQIRAQVGTMNRLVDDLFELSLIQSGTLKLRPENVELLDIVSDAVADVSQLAAARGIQISHAGVEGRMLWADPHELTRVVVNLLTNSIRYSPADSQILVSADQRDDTSLVLSVLDQGSGVASEDLSHMFEIGWRATEARTPDQESSGSGGAGLGLAIVRGIVEAHGGGVNAENGPEGFRLNVALPTGVAAR
ncbi:HAMP domain-containing histidine kinase [Salinibacterium sp. NG22]|uniref:sensor histidine kinase n=1 Tax=Salinibacterium sp. NG22 TaxID=2792040 RepID=UPI0018CED93E|nr:HAMP domain-containing sensor histidine kinase [Salinibacterium sp. NG22]MBH0110692.1 HAMP domain-containing histidine kinase [Salinibacterium sp. NG22]